MKDWMLTDEQMDKAYILGSYEGDKFGHSAIAKAEARKVVGAIKKHIEDNSGHLDMFWFMRLCKDVES